MLTIIGKKATPKTGNLPPGICRHARQFGVTRQHLFHVLNGQRYSPALLKHYRELPTGKARQEAKS